MNAQRSTPHPLHDESSPSDQLRNQLPVRYYDGQMLSVLYAIDRRDADEALGECGACAVALPLGKALLTLSWFHYPDSTIGAYDEFAVAILANSRRGHPSLPLLRALAGDPAVGGFVLHLPVTSELACVGGRELYGFPKVLAEITLIDGSTEARAELAMDGRPILRMRIPAGRGVPLRLSQLSTFSVLHGALLCTRIPLRGGRAELMSARGATLELLAPDAPVARTVGHLVGRRRALGVLAARGFAAELREGFLVSRPG